MLFNSIEFLIFLPIVTVLYAITPDRFRWAILLAASYIFYMAWRVEYIVLIIASTVVDYWAARKIYTAQTVRMRQVFLSSSVAVNLGILGFFKYFNFFNESFGGLFPTVSVLLPVGISFYTFQTMSYTLDVYRGHIEPERHFGRFALFVTFFPQLVAGPIERAGRLLPQLQKTPQLRWNDIEAGLQRIVVGFVKKVVIADRLAILVNTVYADPGSFNGPQLILATVFFGFQIYGDFSGYSDIAIGTARIFGVNLMENFNRPYLAQSISEFWSRWHISLSTWFRDYVYIPLGGNRAKPARVGVNLLVTFLLSGLWHGANWTFVAWGAYHGALLVLEKVLAKRFASDDRREHASWIVRTARIIGTFILVMIGWILFRANTMSDAISILGRLPVGFASFNPIEDFGNLGLNKAFFIWSVLMIVILYSVHVLENQGRLEVLLARRPRIRWITYQSLLLVLLIMGVTTGESQFIYFQF